MGQLSLVYKPAHAGHETWQLELDLLRVVVAHLGHKEVAFELDINGSTLSDALHERANKRWAAEWTHIVKAMLSQRYDEPSHDLLVRLTDLGASFCPDDPPRSPEELAAAFEVELKKMGEAGERAISRVRGTKRRR